MFWVICCCFFVDFFFSERWIFDCSLVFGSVHEIFKAGQVVLAAVRLNVGLIHLHRFSLRQILNLLEGLRIFGEKVDDFRSNLLDEVLSMGASGVLVHNEDHVWCLQVNAISNDKRSFVLVLLDNSLRWHP